ncbi:fumarylacetoacetase [Castellaniella sp. GW247-6E4]|uniref:fumarylacetoacetase n=1 Tax=Castellaniella sp. GW247-6E4 TaxID=3140380 RepID=UPI0033151199
MLNETHDKTLTSWVQGAQEPGGDFPIQNLPFGVFAPKAGGEARLGVAIGDYVLDLRAAVEQGLVAGDSEPLARACRQATLNELMGLGPQSWHVLRLALSRLLRKGSGQRAQTLPLLRRHDDVEMRLPATVGDYTDFYTSIHHATNAGKIFRPDNPLYPNFTRLPVGYHGRASSIVASGHPCRRPWGQQRRPEAAEPVFAPSTKLDFELELAIFVGPGNAPGEPIPMASAEQHVFGVCLLNDWSARDIQAWEYQPLGPFLGKSFLTTISPWIVTMEALEPFRRSMTLDPAQPAVPAYLSDPAHDQRGALGIEVEVALETDGMRGKGQKPAVLAKAAFAQQYWSVFQMLAHHASNGCNLNPGDLMGTGTISGPTPGEEGCLLEKTLNGARPVELPSGESRTFLEDGDEVIMRARCEREGFVSIGFGECRGRIEPSTAYPGVSD